MVPKHMIQEYIDYFLKVNEMKIVRGANWKLEIGAITDLNAKKYGPALLFNKIKDYPTDYRVVTCMLSGPRRLSYTIGAPSITSTDELLKYVEGKPFEWESLANAYPPKIIDQNEIEGLSYSEEVDLFKFPTPLWHEGDGGRYIGTGGCVITKDPDIGVINLGTYRVMVHDKNTVGVFIEDINHGNIQNRKYHKQGKPCPVAMSFGHDLLIYIASSMPIPYELSEYNYAGSIRKESIQAFLGKITGLPIPATTEIAVEGYIYPNDFVQEGPFAEFTGYYGGDRAPRYAVRLKSIYYRKNPIILGSLTGKPPFDHSYWRSLLESAAIRDRLRKAGVPEVKKVWRHEAGCSQFWTVVSISQQYIGHARQAGYIAAQCVEGASMGRYVIVVDDDIDPQNLQEVIWALSTRSDPATGIEILHRAPSNPLDPIIKKPTTHYESSRAVIDACKPFEWIDGFPKTVAISKDLEMEVRSKWPDLLEGDSK